MMVYVLTMYDPVAQTGYTEVFASFDLAIRYTGLKGWKKRGDMWVWASDTEEVRVSGNKQCFSFRRETEVYRIRRKRLRGGFPKKKPWSAKRRAAVRRKA